MVDGLARTAPVARRRDWSEPRDRETRAAVVIDVPPAIRPRLAAAWTQAACMEHASIAAFARFALQLLAVGAPPDLVADAQRAMADEILHAQLTFGLASAYAGVDVGPGKLAVDESTGACDLRALVSAVFTEGCVGETLAALEAREALDYATDPAVREVLRTIAEDETRHAELAWRTVAWVTSTGGAEAHAWLDEAIADEVARSEWDAPYTVSSRDDALRAHGVLTEGLRQQLRRAALAEVIIPCAGAVRSRSTIAA
ncbi:MAG TPA: ferritin-like domain-containing protein [Polyangiaceae bacterium]|nr:ferritin-like domain-containing protein [Polyangiaceae bacterium]